MTCLYISYLEKYGDSLSGHLAVDIKHEHISNVTCNY